MPKRSRSALSLNSLSIAAILATTLLTNSSSANSAAYTFTHIDVPGALFTQAWGITGAAQIVGSFGFSTSPTHGFLDTGGSFTQLDVPGATSQSFLGINGAAQIVGSFSRG